MPLKIAAKVDRVDVEYFKTTIEPLLGSGNVEFIGEIREDQKSEFLGNAAALLFPIAWREPFGLVMIESMACGTPVVAFENGSVPEVLENGVTGFIVHDERQAVEAVGRAIGPRSRPHPRGIRPAVHRSTNGGELCLGIFAPGEGVSPGWGRARVREAEQIQG